MEPLLCENPEIRVSVGGLDRSAESSFEPDNAFVHVYVRFCQTILAQRRPLPHLIGQFLRMRRKSWI